MGKKTAKPIAKKPRKIVKAEVNPGKRGRTMEISKSKTSLRNTKAKLNKINQKRETQKD